MHLLINPCLHELILLIMRINNKAILFFLFKKYTHVHVWAHIHMYINYFIAEKSCLPK